MKSPSDLLAAVLILAAVAPATSRADRPFQLWNSPSDQPAIEGIAQGIAAQIHQAFLATGKAIRDAHAKAHGCVHATLTVLSTAKAAGLDVGVFASAGKTYDAWIRFSNGSGEANGDDRIASGRGMAIKLFGVPGAKFMDDESGTQDFPMINHPVFFVRNATDYVQFEKDAKTFFATHPEEFAVVRALGDPQTNPPMNPLESTYYSMTPRHWSAGRALRPVKFSAIPVSCEGGGEPPKVALKDSSDALRLAMAETLDARDVCFEFRAQKFADARSTPIDDPTKLWTTPFVSIGKIVVPAQRFQSDAQKEFCEDLSITPWHSVFEHQPLGSIEQTRKRVYDLTSEVRHRDNGRARAEPTGKERFP